jgi:N-acetylglucosaminyl-diphospho-decaprenol L-rhamnosyltransferase
MSSLAVIVVNYNTCTLLRNCLRSILTAAQHIQANVSVWVVDNESNDGSAAMVRREFPEVHLLALPRNIGFTSGNNFALAATGFAAPTPPDLPVPQPGQETPTYVMLLNPDAELTAFSLRIFVDFMENHPAVGVCGAQLEYGNGAFQHGAFRFPSLAQVALDFFPLTGVPGAQRLHNSRLNGRYPQAWWAQNEPFAVDFVLGAAMFVRGSAIQQVGVLDPEYWMYCEEMDWCMRMGDRGWQVYALPSVRVIHHEAQSSRQVRWWAYERLWKSRFYFYSRHRSYYPAGYVLLLRLLIKLGTAKRRRLVESQFARGEITGLEAGDALHALATVAQL